MSKASAILAPKKVRFSYSTADQPALQRAVIQAIERIGGQRKLKKLYFQHQKSVKGGENFFDAAIRLMRMKVEFDEAALARTPATGPVLFIANDEDVQIPPFAADAMSRVIPGALAVHIPDAGHSAYFERPQAFNRIVDEFLTASAR